MKTGDKGRQSTEQFLLDVYEKLLARYGEQHWWPGDGPFEVIVGAILTQSAAWANVDTALRNLKEAGMLTVAGLRQASQAELARLVHPAGYYNAKAAKLKAFVEMIDDHYEGRLESLLADQPQRLRDRLLATHGIGPETADDILLYAAGHPVFVVDAYTRRTMRRLGLGPSSDSYDEWRAFFMTGLPANTGLMNEYHALLVRHGKEHCRSREPICGGCPLLDNCHFAQRASNGSRLAS